MTLIEKPYWQTLNDPNEADEAVWGTAYRIPADKVKETKEYLDIREINGYVRNSNRPNNYAQLLNRHSPSITWTSTRPRQISPRSRHWFTSVRAMVPAAQ